MAYIKCPKCGSMDVSKTFNKGINTHNLGSMIMGGIGGLISGGNKWVSQGGAALGSGIDNYLEASYYEYHCYRCDHTWKVEINNG